jgi:hypothetical protein
MKCTVEKHSYYTVEWKVLYLSLCRMNAFLHFIINNETIHRFWDSVVTQMIENGEIFVIFVYKIGACTQYF